MKILSIHNSDLLLNDSEKHLVQNGKYIGECYDILLGGIYANKTGLKSVENFPRLEVKGIVHLSDNKLTSLKGISKFVNVLYCGNNKLTDLEHCPEHIYFANFSKNKITTLKHFPKKIDYHINLNINKIEFIDCDDDTVIGNFMNVKNNPIKSLYRKNKYIKRIKCDNIHDNNFYINFEKDYYPEFIQYLIERGESVMDYYFSEEFKNTNLYKSQFGIEKFDL